MRRENLQHMFAVLWLKMRLHLDGHFESIRCAYRYTVCLRNRFFSVIVQVLQTKTIISGYGTHFWNEEIEAFSHHPDVLFGVVPCLYALLIRPVHMTPMNAILFQTNQEEDR